MRRLTGLLSITVTLIIITLALPQTAQACSPAPESQDYTFVDRINHAPIVLIGTVTGGETRGGTYEVITTAQVEVETVYKGEAQALEHISNFGDGADCLSWVQVGDRLAFFAERTANGTLQASYLSVHDAAWSVDGFTIDTLETQLGIGSDPAPLPFQQTFLLWILNNIYITGFIGITAITLVILGIYLISRQHRDPRKSKPKRG